MNKAAKNFFRLRGYVWNIGYRPALGSYEKRKLGIFNFMNFLGLVTGIVLPVVAWASPPNSLPPSFRRMGYLSAVVSVIVLLMNHFEKYEAARLVFFTAYPVVTSLLYPVRIDIGMEFFFVLFAVL